METLKNNIRIKTMLVPAVIDEDNSPITSTVIDTYENAEEDTPKFGTALVIANLGTFGANLTSVKIKIHESANSNGSSSTLADGGAEVTVTEAGQVQFQVKRTKRYLLAILTLAATSTADTVPASIVAVLGNWAKPFPII
jgi:hypothetical protein